MQAVSLLKLEKNFSNGVFCSTDFEPIGITVDFQRVSRYMQPNGQVEHPLVGTSRSIGRIATLRLERHLKTGKTSSNITIVRQLSNENASGENRQRGENQRDSTVTLTRFSRCAGMNIDRHGVARPELTTC